MSEQGYDEWLDALDDGDGYYIECSEGHGSLPPRRVCPHCGTDDLSETSLPDSGTVETCTVVHVAAPDFADLTPYATAVADFGDVRLTGFVREEDLDAVDVGAAVEPSVGVNPKTGDRMVVFQPR